MGKQAGCIVRFEGCCIEAEATGISNSHGDAVKAPCPIGGILPGRSGASMAFTNNYSLPAARRLPERKAPCKDGIPCISAKTFRKSWRTEHIGTFLYTLRPFNLIAEITREDVIMLKHLSTITLFAALGLAGCSSAGLPSATSPASGSSGSASASQSVAGGTQLGVTGDGGVLSTAGADVVSPLLGEGGLLGATLAGGSDGLVGSAVAGAGAGSSPLPSGGLSALDGALTQVSESVPPLGVSGDGGLGQDLLGYDLVGDLVGTDGGVVPALLGGGESAPLGSALPGGSAPLQPVGDLLAGVVDGVQTNATVGNFSDTAPLLQPLLLTALGAGGGDSPLSALPLDALPLDQLQPVLIPAVSLVNQVTSTPLPGGQTAGDVVFPVVLGSALGVVGNTLPLGDISESLAVLP